MECKTIISIISLILASVSIVITLLLYLLSKYNFQLSNRPYLVFQSCTINVPLENKNILELPHGMMYKCFRTPAELIKGELWISVFNSENKKEERIDAIPIKPEIILPMGKGQEEEAIVFGEPQLDKIKQKFLELKENEELRQQVRFNYKWAGDNKFNKKYSYYGMWTLPKYEKVLDSRQYDWRLTKQEIT